MESKSKKLTDAQEMRKIIDIFEYNKKLSLKEYIQNNEFSVGFSNPISLRFIDKTNIGSNKLVEAVITTYPIDVTIRHMKGFFGFNDEFIYPYKDTITNTETIRVMIFADTEEVEETNKKIIEDAMSACGWYFSCVCSRGIKYWHKTETLEFCKKYPNNISEELRKETDCLYHVSPEYYKNKILNTGFCPYDRNAFFKNPSFVHFIKGNVNDTEIIGLTDQLSNANTNPTNNKIYYIYKVDLNKIPKNVVFIQDPKYIYGVATMSNINKNTIVGVGRINLNNKKPIIEWN